MVTSILTQDVVNVNKYAVEQRALSMDRQGRQVLVAEVGAPSAYLRLSTVGRGRLRRKQLFQLSDAGFESLVERVTIFKKSNLLDLRQNANGTTRLVYRHCPRG